MLTAIMFIVGALVLGLLLQKLTNRAIAGATGFLALVLSALAQPAYTGTAFDQIQEVADDGALFFGVIVALAIVVTGFFLGRRWLRRVG